MHSSRFIAVILGCLVLLGLYGCGKKGQTDTDFDIRVNPETLEMEVGTQKTLEVTVERKNLDADTPIYLTLAKPVDGLNAPEVTLTGSKGFFKIASSKTGNFDLQLKASTKTLSKTVPLSVTVIEATKQPAVEIYLEPSSLTIDAGNTSSVQVSIERKNGFDQTVLVQTSNVPTGVTASSIVIAPNETQGTITFSSDTSAIQGSYSVLLTAKNESNTVSDSSHLELRITKPFTNTLVKETIATGLRIPWDLTFTPDGILYFTEREGNFKKVIDGHVVPVSHPLNVHAETESGLMGIDFDPQYPSEPYLYVCYSYRTEALEIKNRVSRLTVQETSLNDEQILIDEIPGGTNHNGCRITFGPDNKLYITMGDARVGGNAQSVNNLSGKIMRINRDGSIPTDNPFLGSQVWSYGHRNAQGITFHSNGRLYSSEHGDASEDEINRIIPGGNYGWPLVEGRCNTPSEEVNCNGSNLLEPLTVYSPTLGVSGLAFYDKDMFPEWRGNLLLASLKAGRLYRIILDSEGRAVDEELLVSNDYGRLRDVEVGPDGSIYIAVSNRDGRAFPPFPQPEDDRIVRWSMQ